MRQKWKNSPAAYQGEKDSRQGKNVDKAKKNIKNVKERTKGKKESKGYDSKASIDECVVLKDKGIKGKRWSAQKSNDGKRNKSVRKVNSESVCKVNPERSGSLKLPFDPKDFHYYSDDFDESGDASDTEEGEFIFSHTTCQTYFIGSCRILIFTGFVPLYSHFLFFYVSIRVTLLNV